MIKPSLFLTLLLIVGLSAAIYGVENRVHSLHQELSAMQRDIVNDRRDIHVLKAEWSYLARPSRIEQLVEQHFTTDTISPNNIVLIGQVALEDDHQSPFSALQEYTLSQRN